METRFLTSGYKDRGTLRQFREMTVRDVLADTFGRHLFFEDKSGNYRECRTNGKAKTWKTRPTHVSLPVKYGLYECTRAESFGGSLDDVVRLPSGKPLLIAVD